MLDCSVSLPALFSYIRSFPCVVMVHAFSSYESRGLLELSLIYCPRVRDSAFLELGRGCSLLRSLYLVDCSRIGDDAMCHIARGCKNLTEISIRRGYEVSSKFASVYYGDRWEIFVCVQFMFTFCLA